MENKKKITFKDLSIPLKFVIGFEFIRFGFIIVVIIFAIFMSILGIE